MYADHVTDSMRKSWTETTRRRKIQKQYNIDHSITPLASPHIEKGMRPDLPRKLNVPNSTSKDSQRRIQKFAKDLTAQMDLAPPTSNSKQAAELRIHKRPTG